MKKSRYTEQQIAFALKQAKAGTPVSEVLRRTSLGWMTPAEYAAAAAQRAAE